MSDLFAVPRLPKELPSDPLQWVKDWLEEAFAKKTQRNPHSMACVTVDSENRPAARMVLCKDVVPDPGYVVFYTNYKSEKAQHIQDNPNVALVLHWDALGRQVRIEGQAIRSPAEESDAYFATRDWLSQIGAWGSDQSAVLESRAALLAQVRDRALELGVSAVKNLRSITASDRNMIPRPPHWGGYRVWARRVELWIEGRDRIHDRARWERSLEPRDATSFKTGEWTSTRLQP
ncbi:MAG: pyridoxamine 5'-phosphate oxidase [Gammaproteobacteria bacterium]|nr:pyridoxamine 5'-phosphate oxidase [Gammaproteobacteria bacterium]